MLPNVAPETRKPKPRERSPEGSTRPIVCAPPGKPGPSARPSEMRATRRAAKPGTAACSADTTDHTSTETTSPRRAPARSIHHPESGPETRYASANADVSEP